MSTFDPGSVNDKFDAFDDRTHRSSASDDTGMGEFSKEDFQISAKVNQGGQATVYQCKSHTGKLYCLKVFKRFVSFESELPPGLRALNRCLWPQLNAVKMSRISKMKAGVDLAVVACPRFSRNLFIFSPNDIQAGRLDEYLRRCPQGVWVCLNSPLPSRCIRSLR